jgi:ABC-type sugar transport system ATPase subunit
VNALTQVDLRIDVGEVVSVIGENAPQEHALKILGGAAPGGDSCQ